MFKEFTNKIAVNCRKQDKYEVGDRVLVVNKPIKMECSWCSPEMDSFCGKIVTVNAITRKGDYAANGWEWSKDAFVGKVIDNPTPEPKPTKQDEPFLKAYIHGNKTVVILSDGRKGKAWCSPDDKQNELTGLTLALKRAIGEEVQTKQGKGKPKPEGKEIKGFLFMDEPSHKYGNIGDKTNFIDKDGESLFIGDVVRSKTPTDRDCGDAFVCSDGDVFVMGIGGTRFIKKGRNEGWTTKKVKSYKDLKNGDTVGCLTVKIPTPRGAK